MNLREKRLEKGMTQEQVAKLAGLKRPTYTMIENGKRNTKPEKVRKIAAVLDFPWPDYYEEADDGTSQERCCG